MSDAFQVFMKECPKHAQAWLAALRLDAGVPFHVAIAKEAGASREEVISAILVGLPAAGNAVTHALPAAIGAYDQK